MRFHSILLIAAGHGRAAYDSNLFKPLGNFKSKSYEVLFRILVAFFLRVIDLFLYLVRKVLNFLLNALAHLESRE